MSKKSKASPYNVSVSIFFPNPKIHDGCLIIVPFKFLNQWRNMEQETEINRLAEEFSSCRRLLSAIGDETRIHIIIEMMKVGKCSGLRVNEIAKTTNLSRPAVSHHLKIMKDAGILKVRKEGTKNYYYFDPEPDSFQNLCNMLTHAMSILKRIPDRSQD